MFKFGRRINRATYFAALLLSFLYLIFITLIVTIASNFSMSKVITIAVYSVLLLCALVLPVYWLCLTRQRANDISGDNALLYTFLGVFILGAIIGVIPGERRANRYGSPPKKGVTLR